MRELRGVWSSPLPRNELPPHIELPQQIIRVLLHHSHFTLLQFESPLALTTIKGGSNVSYSENLRQLLHSKIKQVSKSLPSKHASNFVNEIQAQRPPIGKMSSTHILYSRLMARLNAKSLKRAFKIQDGY